MSKPKCYIPLRLKDIYKKYNSIEEIHDNKRLIIECILSIYLDYRSIPTELNDNEPDDPVGLGILECLCIKLIANPQFTRHIRDIYGNLDEFYDELINKRKSMIDIIDNHFTIEELRFYGF